MIFFDPSANCLQSLEIWGWVAIAWCSSGEHPTLESGDFNRWAFAKVEMTFFNFS
jgi:hypothetical protein